MPEMGLKKRHLKIRSMVLLLLGCLLLASCGNLSHSVPGLQAKKMLRKPIDTGQLKIGYIKNKTLFALKERGELERSLASLPVKVQWLEFPNDKALYEALQEGRADFVGVGDAVPAFLYNESDPLIYLSAEPFNPGSHAIVVRLDSNIFNPADLKNKKVAYVPHSNEHLLLLQTLNKNGLSIKDVKNVSTQPADIKDSFDSQKADAWVIAEPELSRIESAGIRTIANGSDLVGNREIYLTTPENLQTRRELFDSLLKEINLHDDWMTNQVHDAAELLTAHSNVEHNTWLSAFERQAYGTAPFLVSIVLEEQSIVDTLVSLGERKKSYNVKDFLAQNP